MIQIHDEETIVAQCTPSGAGAIALIRITGTDAIAIATEISSLASGRSLDEQSTHTIHYGSVRGQDGAALDHVLFLLMRGPQTFTGQDTVEITCHNNPFIIESIIAAATERGARLAQHGEFTKRAVLHKKIDLMQAEAINELIHAQTRAALKQSLAQLQGSFSHWIVTLEKNLLRALALCQASFEFIEEENITFDRDIETIVTDALAAIAQLKTTFDNQNTIRNGIRIAFIGSVNAGKSSLFNALLAQNRSIVTPIPGTTRDVIEAGMYRTGTYWTLIDTAGLRQTNDVIEQEGIKRSWEQAHSADIILLIIDSSRPMTAQEEIIYRDMYHRYARKIIPIATKADLPPAQQPALSDQQSLPMQHNSASHAAALIEILEAKSAELLRAGESPFLINKRHFTLLCSLETQLKIIHTLFQKTVAHEIVAYHLTHALAQLGEMSGKTISEASMDAVFREFCVGK